MGPTIGKWTSTKYKMICLATNPEHTKHTFNDYKILNNDQFLRIAYIKAHSEVKRVLDLQKAAHQASKSKAINSIESISASSTPFPKEVAISQIMSIINEDSKQDFRRTFNISISTN